MEKQRYAFIDVLRIIACFLVIVNHTNSTIFLTSSPSLTWFISLTYFFISKVAVPIFVMISGYTMLHRVDDYAKVVRKLLRVVVALFLFSAVYYVNQYYMGTRAVYGIKDFILTVLQNPITNAFWYMYLYVGLLIMLPFLQKFVASLEKKDFHIFFGISGLVFSTWPIIEHMKPALTYSRFMAVPLFDSFVCLLLMGYYMKTYVTPSKNKTMIAGIGFVVSCAFNVIMTYFEYIKNGGNDYLFYDNRIYLPIVLQSVCLFYLVSQISINEQIARFVKVIGGCTFGIYLISDLLIEKFMFVFEDLCTMGVYSLVAVVLFEIIVFVVGCGITFVLKQIPGVKKVL